MTFRDIGDIRASAPDGAFTSPASRFKIAQHGNGRLVRYGRMTENLIDRAWDVFERVQKRQGAPYPDEVSFVGGFTACFGIITGRVDVGLDENAPLTQHLDLLHRAIADFAQRVGENQRKTH